MKKNANTQLKQASHVIPAETCAREGIYGRRLVIAKAYWTALEAIDPRHPTRPTLE